VATSSSGTRGELFGASGRHARVVVMTVTEKEFPVAKEVFGRCEPIVDVGMLGAWTHRSFADEDHLPFVLVRAVNRSNLGAGHDVNHWVRNFRPQAFILVGTAGGVWRPKDADRKKWKGPLRGDVMVSEFIHYGDYSKVTPCETLPRYLRLEQPADDLLYQAMQLTDEPTMWQPWLGPTWEGQLPKPSAHEEEFLSGEQIQDDPLHATQQYLMKNFDRAGAVEMESAGLAQALHSLRVTATYAPGFISVRGVSDLVWARDREGKLRPRDVKKAKQFDERNAAGANVGPQATSAAQADERDDWSPRAAASASAFALALVRRIVARTVDPTVGHPAVPSFDIQMSDPTHNLET
jgi:nucleoside phosphorylase